MAVTKVVMPKLSEAMETGKLLRWLKQQGDRISGGDIIAEIETDKADIELEAFGAGVLRKLLAEPGASVPVGSLIAVIAEPDDDIGALVGDGAGAPAPAPAPTPAAPRAPAAAEPAGTGSRPSGSTGSVAGAPAVAMAAPFVAGGGRLRASPLAKKLAQRAGIDLGLVAGTGPGGRIIQRDIEGFLAGRGAVPAAAAAPAPSPAAVPAPARPMAPAALPAAAVPKLVRPSAEPEDLPLSQIRAAIARQMTLSKGPVPHFYVTAEVAMERAVALREELQALPGAPKVTFTDLIVRACAVTLLKHPGVNASVHGETIRRYRAVHVGIAVALDEGLITPVLRDCDQKSIFQIATEAELASASTSRTSSGAKTRGSRVATVRMPTGWSSSSSGTPRNETRPSSRTRPRLRTRSSVRRSFTTTDVR